MADRVDRPRDVVHEEDPDQAAPDVAAQRALPGEAVQHVAEHRRDQQRREHVEREAPADGLHLGILVEVPGVLLPVGLALGLHQPAGVGVPEAAQTAAVADVRAVRVALDVGVRVVLAVVGDPVEDRALHAQLAQPRERALEPRVDAEGAMRQQPVEADGHPHRGREVHHRKDREVDRVDPRAPQQHDGHQDARERHDDAGEVGVALDSGHVFARWRQVEQGSCGHRRA